MAAVTDFCIRLSGPAPQPAGAYIPYCRIPNGTSAPSAQHMEPLGFAAITAIGLRCVSVVVSAPASRERPVMFQTRDWFCGHLRAIGHGKDVIIRGGDNIPVVEVESLLCRHPANAMAAIVAYPRRAPGRARLRRGGAQARASHCPATTGADSERPEDCRAVNPRAPDRARCDALHTVWNDQEVQACATCCAKKACSHRHPLAIGLQTS